VQPAIQYVRTADGVRIAYWELGEGAPLVVMPSTPYTHVRLEWEIPECREWYQRLSRGRRLVRYDSRGFGLSDRQVADFSLEAQILDLEAVVDRLGLGTFALFASGDSGLVAIAYAARHPEHVSHLLLWHSWARRADVSQTPQTRALLAALLEQDWEVYTDAVARAYMVGPGGEDLVEQFAAFYRECASAETLRLLQPVVYEWDVTPLVPQVRAPVLVLSRSKMPSVRPGIAMDLATGFPDARLVLLEGTSPLPWRGGDVELTLRAVSGFLGEDEPGAAAAPRSSGSVTILFTDMESSTDLTGRLGDEGAQELVRAHNRIVREALRAHAGSDIKHTGDGIMASFGSAGDALECAVAIQRAVAARNESAETGFRVRIGLNAGEPVAEESDLFGTSVQLAARIRDHAQPGQILASNVVRELVAGKPFLFADGGQVALKGFEEPVRVFEVRWQE
jgi:class 3 adenylate cyclase